MSTEDLPVAELQRLAENQRVVEELQYAVSQAPREISLLRRAIVAVIRRSAWTDRIDNRLGRSVQFREMLGLVTSPPLEGLGSDVDTIRRLLGDCPERVEFDLALRREPGGLNNPEGKNQHGEEEGKEEVNHDNIMIDQPPAPSPPKAKQGTSAEYAHRQLAAKRPDLLEKVKAKELSANAAMIEAGLRKKPTPLDILKRAWAKASEAERLAFLNWTAQEGGAA